MKNFAAFILTHGRPDNVTTIEALRSCNYTGEIYLIIDDEDETAEEYYKRFGKDKVFVINSSETAKTTDVCDNLQHHNSVIYKRNASFRIASELGLKYFMQLDDDYIDFRYRFKNGDSLLSRKQKSLDEAIHALIEFMEDSNATTVAMAQAGDFIGGLGSNIYRQQLVRKVMNSWLFRTDRPLQFVGRLNDDVNTYLTYGARGELMFTPAIVCVNPAMTQVNKGGMTELYLDTGTYMKSMYSVVVAPSCVTVRSMGPANPRLHHHIEWNNCVPKIISDKHRNA